MLTAMNTIERFLDSDDAGWKLEPLSEKEFQDILEQVGEQNDCILIVKSRTDMALINRNKIRVKATVQGQDET